MVLILIKTGLDTDQSRRAVAGWPEGQRARPIRLGRHWRRL